MTTEMNATPPKGYVECRKKCGNWTPQKGACWHCLGPKTVAAAARNHAAGMDRSGPDWQPPIAAPQHSPAMAKIEVKTTVDGKCPLCGVTVPSTHIHLCSQPQHVERRKVEVGQRRRNRRDTFTVFAIIEGKRALVCQAGQIDPVTDFVHKGDESCCWESIEVLEDCEVVADAPAEPGKPDTKKREPGCQCHLEEGDSPCRVHDAPPAHEAPKAAPVVVCIDCDTAPIAHPVPMRFVGLVHRARPICDDCYLARETHIGDHDYTPYKGPERLRNVLARDELVEWDCLEDA